MPSDIVPQKSIHSDNYAPHIPVGERWCFNAPTPTGMRYSQLLQADEMILVVAQQDNASACIRGWDLYHAKKDSTVANNLDHLGNLQKCMKDAQAALDKNQTGDLDAIARVEGYKVLIKRCENTIREALLKIGNPAKSFCIDSGRPFTFAGSQTKYTVYDKYQHVYTVQ